jgi:hypothetical protein
MFKKWSVAVYLLFCLFGWVGSVEAQYECYSNNTVAGPHEYTGIDYREHAWGNHNWNVTFAGTCAYYYQNDPNNPCAIAASVTASPLSGDAGRSSMSNPLYVHNVGTQVGQGGGASNGPSVTVTGDGAFAVRSCLLSCGVSISMSGSAATGGYSFGFPSDAIWTDRQAYPVVCGQMYPVQICPGGKCNGGNSPLVMARRGVDATEGWSDPSKECVMFDLKYDGHPTCFSFPARGSRVGFLVLDGKYVFGNYTFYADCGMKGHPSPNGYCALSWYDKTANGGNQDMQITAEDGVWTRLSLWTPDHCWDAPQVPCTPIDSELHSLASEGIHSIGLLYGNLKKCDQWGNCFRFYGQLNPKPHELLSPDDDMNERRSWDVFLAQKP